MTQLQGRVLMGTFAGVKQVTKRDGTPVPGMFEISVAQEGREWPHRAVFFSTDEDGNQSRMQLALDALALTAGASIAVRISSKASSSVVNDEVKLYVNDTATGVYVVDATASNGSKSPARV